MSEKNFASYGDMETLLTEVASKCGPYTEISYNDWLQLTPYQQEHGRWDVTGVPGVDLTKGAHFYNLPGGGNVSVDASSCILFAKRAHQQSAYDVNAIYYLVEGNAFAMVNSGGNTNAISTSYSNSTITITNNNAVAIHACVIT